MTAQKASSSARCEEEEPVSSTWKTVRKTLCYFFLILAVLVIITTMIMIAIIFINKYGDTDKDECADANDGLNKENILETDECASKPCLNGATCANINNGYSCECGPGFKGINCQEIDECASNPCLNRASCADINDGYICECAAGFKGTNCEEIDECLSNPCLNEATCADVMNGYECACADGFTGDHCEIDTDECASDPCLNQSRTVCLDVKNGYACVCVDGFRGQNCDIGLSLFAAITSRKGTYVPQLPADEVLQFDEVLVDSFAIFNGTKLVVPANGLYLVSLGAGVVSMNTRLQLSTENNTGVAAIQYPTKQSTYDTISRDVILNLNKDTELKVVLKEGIPVDGYGEHRLTSMSVFSYSSLMKPGGVAFTVGYTSSSGEIGRGRIFNDIVPQFNLGEGFEQSSGSFQSPRNGIYFFAVTLVADPQVSFQFVVTPSQSAPYFGVGRDFLNVTLSRSILLRLSVGDTVLPNNQEVPIHVVGSENIETSFSGFLYEPAFSESVAYFAFLDNKQYTTTQDTTLTSYSTIPVNEGNDFKDGVFVCRIAGVYFFHFTAGKPEADAKADILLMKNDTAACGILLDLSQGTVMDLRTISRSIILELQTGDQVFLMAKAGSKIYAAAFFFSFLGMLLQ